LQLGQPIRLLVAYTEEEVEERKYELGPNFDKSDWLKVKFTLGLDFPNLPYYIDGI
jgi:glutathione S-transferase